MNTQTKQIHLRNMLSCLTEIEQYCTDLNSRQLEDEELMTHLQLNFTILGLEAANADIPHPVIDVLKSFIHMDFSRDMGGDKYALYNFIVNDIDMIKATIMQMNAPVKKIRRNQQKYRMAI